MPRSTREIEVKLPFPSPQEAADRLRSMGAEAVTPPVFEDNVVLDDDASGLASSGLLLRLRTAGGRSVLTFKAAAEPGTRYKVREETEILVDDPERTLEILGRLGYRPVWRYQKLRSTFSWEGLEATVDETPIGCWVELEGAPETIDRAAAALGFAPDAYVTASYGDLARKAAARMRRPFRDVCVFRDSRRRDTP